MPNGVDNFHGFAACFLASSAANPSDFCNFGVTAAVIFSNFRRCTFEECSSLILQWLPAYKETVSIGAGDLVSIHMGRIREHLTTEVSSERRSGGAGRLHGPARLKT